MQLALSKGWKYTNIELNFEVTCVQITEKNYFHPRSIFWYTYSFYNFRYELFQTKKKKNNNNKRKGNISASIRRKLFQYQKKKKKKKKSLIFMPRHVQPRERMKSIRAEI